VRRLDDHFKSGLRNIGDGPPAAVLAESESGRPPLREGRFTGLPVWYHALDDPPAAGTARTDDGESFEVDDAIACLQFEHYVDDAKDSGGEERRLRQLYYLLKPLMPRGAQLELQRVNARRRLRAAKFPAWPEDATLFELLLAFLGERMREEGVDRVPFIGFWPHERTWAWCLTHDIETEKGQAQLGPMAATEEARGLGSSWNFVPEERYRVDRSRMEALRGSGHEIGVHGLDHSGQLFSSRTEFERSRERINEYAHEWNAVGFRSPATYRNPFWLPELDVDYDTSFMDNATLEPQRGGVCASYPFMLSERMVELPITLPMDHTLINVLRREIVPAFATKLAWVQRQHGLALALFHPDYNLGTAAIDRYGAVLDLLRDEPGGWFALPYEIAAWWQRRRSSQIVLRDGQPFIEGPAADSGSIWWAERDGGAVRIVPA
jgi:hypothetical protein